jgi:hypothetical protein
MIVRSEGRSRFRFYLCATVVRGRGEGRCLLWFADVTVHARHEEGVLSLGTLNLFGAERGSTSALEMVRELYPKSLFMRFTSWERPVPHCDRVRIARIPRVTKRKRREHGVVKRTFPSLSFPGVRVERLM